MSSKGGLIHKNFKEDTNNTDSPPAVNKNTLGEPLSLFSTLKDREVIIRNFTERYHLDMVLFGYNITLHNGTYYATCNDGQMLC